VVGDGRIPVSRHSPREEFSVFSAVDVCWDYLEYSIEADVNFCNRFLILTGAIVVAVEDAVRCRAAACRVVVVVVWCFRVGE
jgi:hypothetical protein